MRLHGAALSGSLILSSLSGATAGESTSSETRLNRPQHWLRRQSTDQSSEVRRGSVVDRGLKEDTIDPNSPTALRSTTHRITNKKIRRHYTSDSPASAAGSSSARGSQDASKHRSHLRDSSSGPTTMKTMLVPRKASTTVKSSAKRTSTLKTSTHKISTHKISTKKISTKKLSTKTTSKKASTTARVSTKGNVIKTSSKKATSTKKSASVVRGAPVVSTKKATSTKKTSSKAPSKVSSKTSSKRVSANTSKPTTQAKAVKTSSSVKKLSSTSRVATTIRGAKITSTASHKSTGKSSSTTKKASTVSKVSTKAGVTSSSRKTAVASSIKKPATTAKATTKVNAVTTASKPEEETSSFSTAIPILTGQSSSSIRKITKTPTAIRGSIKKTTLPLTSTLISAGASSATSQLESSVASSITSEFTSMPSTSAVVSSLLSDTDSPQVNTVATKPRCRGMLSCPPESPTSRIPSLSATSPTSSIMAQVTSALSSTSLSPETLAAESALLNNAVPSSNASGFSTIESSTNPDDLTNTATPIPSTSFLGGNIALQSTARQMNPQRGHLDSKTSLSISATPTNVLESVLSTSGILSSPTAGVTSGANAAPSSTLSDNDSVVPLSATGLLSGSTRASSTNPRIAMTHDHLSKSRLLSSSAWQPSQTASIIQPPTSAEFTSEPSSTSSPMPQISDSSRGVGGLLPVTTAVKVVDTGKPSSTQLARPTTISSVTSASLQTASFSEALTTLELAPNSVTTSSVLEPTSTKSDVVELSTPAPSATKASIERSSSTHEFVSGILQVSSNNSDQGTTSAAASVTPTPMVVPANSLASSLSPKQSTTTGVRSSSIINIGLSATRSGSNTVTASLARSSITSLADSMLSSVTHTSQSVPTETPAQIRYSSVSSSSSTQGLVAASGKPLSAEDLEAASTAISTLVKLGYTVTSSPSATSRSDSVISLSLASGAAFTPGPTISEEPNIGSSSIQRASGQSTSASQNTRSSSTSSDYALFTPPPVFDGSAVSTEAFFVGETPARTRTESASSVLASFASFSFSSNGASATVTSDFASFTPYTTLPAISPVRTPSISITVPNMIPALSSSALSSGTISIEIPAISEQSISSSLLTALETASHTLDSVTSSSDPFASAFTSYTASLSSDGMPTISSSSSARRTSASSIVSRVSTISASSGRSFSTFVRSTRRPSATYSGFTRPSGSFSTISNLDTATFSTGLPSPSLLSPTTLPSVTDVVTSDYFALKPTPSASDVLSQLQSDTDDLASPMTVLTSTTSSQPDPMPSSTYKTVNESPSASPIQQEIISSASNLADTPTTPAARTEVSVSPTNLESSTQASSEVLPIPSVSSTLASSIASALPSSDASGDGVVSTAPSGDVSRTSSLDTAAMTTSVNLNLNIGDGSIKPTNVAISFSTVPTQVQPTGPLTTEPTQAESAVSDSASQSNSEAYSTIMETSASPQATTATAESVTEASSFAAAPGTTTTLSFTGSNSVSGTSSAASSTDSPSSIEAIAEMTPTLAFLVSEPTPEADFTGGYTVAGPTSSSAGFTPTVIPDSLPSNLNDQAPKDLDSVNSSPSTASPTFSEQESQVTTSVVPSTETGIALPNSTSDVSAYSTELTTLDLSDMQPTPTLTADMNLSTSLSSTEPSLDVNEVPSSASISLNNNVQITSPAASSVKALETALPQVDNQSVLPDSDSSSFPETQGSVTSMKSEMPSSGASSEFSYPSSTVSANLNFGIPTDATKVPEGTVQATSVFATSATNFLPEPAQTDISVSSPVSDSQNSSSSEIEILPSVTEDPSKLVIVSNVSATLVSNLESIVQETSNPAATYATSSEELTAVPTSLQTSSVADKMPTITGPLTTASTPPSETSIDLIPPNSNVTDQPSNIGLDPTAIPTSVLDDVPVPTATTDNSFSSTEQIPSTSSSENLNSAVSIVPESTVFSEPTLSQVPEISLATSAPATTFSVEILPEFTSSANIESATKATENLTTETPVALPTEQLTSLSTTMSATDATPSLPVIDPQSTVSSSEPASYTEMSSIALEPTMLTPTSSVDLGASSALSSLDMASNMPTAESSSATSSIVDLSSSAINAAMTSTVTESTSNVPINLGLASTTQGAVVPSFATFSVEQPSPTSFVSLVDTTPSQTADTLDQTLTQSDDMPTTVSPAASEAVSSMTEVPTETTSMLAIESIAETSELPSMVITSALSSATFMEPQITFSPSISGNVASASVPFVSSPDSTATSGIEEPLTAASSSVVDVVPSVAPESLQSTTVSSAIQYAGTPTEITSVDDAVETVAPAVGSPSAVVTTQAIDTTLSESATPTTEINASITPSSSALMSSISEVVDSATSSIESQVAATSDAAIQATSSAVQDVTPSSSSLTDNIPSDVTSFVVATETSNVSSVFEQVPSPVTAISGESLPATTSAPGISSATSASQQAETSFVSVGLGYVTPSESSVGMPELSSVQPSQSTMVVPASSATALVEATSIELVAPAITPTNIVPPSAIELPSTSSVLSASQSLSGSDPSITPSTSTSSFTVVSSAVTDSEAVPLPSTTPGDVLASPTALLSDESSSPAQSTSKSAPLVLSSAESQNSASLAVPSSTFLPAPSDPQVTSIILPDSSASVIQSDVPPSTSTSSASSIVSVSSTVQTGGSSILSASAVSSPSPSTTGYLVNINAGSVSAELVQTAGGQDVASVGVSQTTTIQTSVASVSSSVSQSISPANSAEVLPSSQSSIVSSSSSVSTESSSQTSAVNPSTGPSATTSYAVNVAVGSVSAGVIQTAGSDNLASVGIGSAAATKVAPGSTSVSTLQAVVPTVVSSSSLSTQASSSSSSVASSSGSAQVSSATTILPVIVPTAGLAQSVSSNSQATSQALASTSPATQSTSSSQPSIAQSSVSASVSIPNAAQTGSVAAQITSTSSQASSGTTTASASASSSQFVSARSSNSMPNSVSSSAASVSFSASNIPASSSGSSSALGASLPASSTTASNTITSTASASGTTAYAVNVGVGSTSIAVLQTAGGGNLVNVGAGQLANTQISVAAANPVTTIAGSAIGSSGVGTTITLPTSQSTSAAASSVATSAAQASSSNVASSRSTITSNNAASSSTSIPSSVPSTFVTLTSTSVSASAARSSTASSVAASATGNCGDSNYLLALGKLGVLGGNKCTGGLLGVADKRDLPTTMQTVYKAAPSSAPSEGGSVYASPHS